MGFFSWNCRGCGVSLRSRYATDNRDHIECVVLLPQGCVLIGDYDGYGRVNDIDINSNPEPECWHRKCWDLAGAPKHFTKSSEYAHDQGYFFDEPSDSHGLDHDDDDFEEEDTSDSHCGW